MHTGSCKKLVPHRRATPLLRLPANLRLPASALLSGLRLVIFSTCSPAHKYLSYSTKSYQDLTLTYKRTNMADTQPHTDRAGGGVAATTTPSYREKLMSGLPTAPADPGVSSATTATAVSAEQSTQTERQRQREAGEEGARGAAPGAASVDDLTAADADDARKEGAASGQDGNTQVRPIFSTGW